MTALLATLLVAGATAPYLLPRASLTPMTGAALWLSVLALRAILILIAALTAILYLPATELFQIATHWCVHAAVPFFATHLGFSGQRIGDAATLLPGLVLGLSLISAIFAAWRTARAIRRVVSREALGPGPRESVIVGGPGVMVVAAGIRDARVVVSTGALTRLDEDELAAGLEHERGHIARRHPYLSLAGSLAFAIARLLPGSRDALAQLRFCLERDADEYAVDRTRDPVALASAICKAAGDGGGASVSRLAGSGAASRLRFLLDRSTAKPNAWAELIGRSMVASLVALVLMTAALSPTIAQAGIASAQQPGPAHPCQG